MFSRQGEREVMSALDADSGKVLWQTGHRAPFTMHSATTQHGPGPKSTPVFANGRLYSIGMTGIVTAYDAASGKQLWQKPGSTPVPMYTTHAFSPLVDGGLVIFHVGGDNAGRAHRYDVNTGAEKWSWKGDGPGYGSPVVVDIEGTRQLITITQGKLVGVDASNGTLLWERPFVITNKTNSVTPVVHGRTIIVSGNGEPTRALAIAKRANQWVTDIVWENADIPLRMSDAVVVGDVLFGLANRNSGQYFAVDADDRQDAVDVGRASGGPRGDRAVRRPRSSASRTMASWSWRGTARPASSRCTATRSPTRPPGASRPIRATACFVKDVSTLSLWTLN